MIRTAPDPQRVIIGAFLVLAAVVCAVAPMPIVFRSAGIVLFAYLAFGMGGMPFAYLAALLAPPIGLLSGSADWLVMLPIVMSGNLLGMLGLEFAWRYGALVLSPLLLVTPALFVQAATRRELFAVDLPWEDARGVWITLHLLVALLGILSAFVLDRRRRRQEAARPGAPPMARPTARGGTSRAEGAKPARSPAGEAPRGRRA